jgi:hypothetical protein
MVFVGGIRVELEHAAGRVHRAGDCSVTGALVGLAQVREQHIGVFQLGSDLIWGQIFDTLLGLIDHRIGVLAFSAYSRASDQANGIAWYAALGIARALLSLAASAVALRSSTPEEQRRPLVLAAAVSVAHTLTTARAAPINFSQRSAGDDEQALGGIFDRFERWQSVRAGLQMATFLAMLRALAVS